MDYDALIRTTYHAFNARDVDAVLAVMHPDVAWPNGMEGGYVHGHEEVRDYWMRQWGIIDPRVEPAAIVEEPDGRFAVQVHQAVRALDGSLLSERDLEHVYTFRDGLVAHMEIRG
jgi:ketosteroid isomerase-like protein